MAIFRDWADGQASADEVDLGEGYFLSTVELEKGGSQLLFILGGGQVLWAPDQDPYGRWEIMGGPWDVDGDGAVDLVFSHWSGGAHCCVTVHAFRLSPGFEVLGTITQGDGDPQYLIPRDDAPPFYVHWDNAFAYWRASFAGSIGEFAAVSFKDGRFALDPTLMRASNPGEAPAFARAYSDALRGMDHPAAEAVEDMDMDATADELAAQAAENPTELGDEVLMPAAQVMLRLIYTGYADRVEGFLATAFPERPVDTTGFLQELLKQLEHSPYFADLDALNDGELSALKERLGEPE
ncbi:MAG: hypothetical protein A2516_01030 [Alphaproteobacteria bacterium RIFOXYD12_FULL_60_8]|nr:MAG: hypothetical protein A2516_01030 [Alphaproteobacteria bacterium RIFOXYD12_FULL_60_8]